MDAGASIGTPLGDHLPYGRDELDRDLHRGVGRRFVGGLILGDRFLVGLRLVMLQNTPNTLFVPSNRILRLAHRLLLRRRRSALSALGPSWYAVITKIETIRRRLPAYESRD